MNKKEKCAVASIFVSMFMLQLWVAYVETHTPTPVFQTAPQLNIPQFKRYT